MEKDKEELPVVSMSKKERLNLDEILELCADYERQVRKRRSKFPLLLYTTEHTFKSTRVERVSGTLCYIRRGCIVTFYTCFADRA